MTDVAPHYTSDSRELDRMTGHEDPTTRERTYQDRLRDEHREGAAEARRDMRRDLTEGRPPPKRRRRADQSTGADEVSAAFKRIRGVELTPDEAEAIARELRRGM